MKDSKYIKATDLNYVIYDIETLKGAFTIYFKSYKKENEKYFVIHESKNDLIELYSFLDILKKYNYYFVGFNNLHFDSKILNFLIQFKSVLLSVSNKEAISMIYVEAQRIIKYTGFEKNYHVFNQIDIFKQKHYDGKAKLGTSLKWLQFTMNFSNIEEMPIHHSTENLSIKDVEKIISYNKNDVLSTYEFFKRNFFETELRVYLSQYFNTNLLNSSEPNMVKTILGKLLAEDMNIPISELKKMRTPRDVVLGKDVIFDYIKFEDPGLQKVYDYFYNLSIRPAQTKEEENKEEDKSYDFIFHNTAITVALGGIHGCTIPGIYKSSSTHKLLDIDVTSFYPNLAIKNNITPEHLGKTFITRYEWFFTERLKYPKSNPLNYIFKICLNTIYGLSKELNSFLYDPKYTYTITINGQLLLLMLAEKLAKIPNLVIYQLNTDGITVGYDPIYEEQVQEIFIWFNKLSQLNLEYAEYTQMNIIDVNNYSAKTIEGKIKRKGLFAYNIPSEVDYHKNPSFLIIPKALDKYLFEGLHPKDYIYNFKNYGEDISLFFGGIKKKSNFDLNLYSIKNGKVNIESQEKVCRFLISKTGGSLIKDFNDNRKTKQIACFKYRKVYPIYNIDICDLEKIIENINYDFYLYKVKELIDVLEQNIQFINYLNELE